MHSQTRIILPLIIFIAIIALLWRGLSLHPNQIPSPLLNKPAPAFALPDLYHVNNTVSNKDFAGHVTLFNVWATWCYACAAEHAKLVELADKEHVFIIGLNYKDNTDAAKKWLLENGNPYKKIAVDETGNTAIDWGVYGAPETFIVDKKGMIRYKQIGPITDEVWQQQLKPLVISLEKES